MVIMALDQGKHESYRGGVVVAPRVLGPNIPDTVE
jgi:hypothetical protein